MAKRPSAHRCHVVKLLQHDPNAKLPTQALDDVGFDLYSVVDVEIPPGSVTLVDTGISLVADPGESSTVMTGAGPVMPISLRTCLQIRGRSGMALKGIWPVGGVVDPSYRAKIGVILFNSTDKPYHVAIGDKVAQFVWEFVVAQAQDQQVLFDWGVESDVEETARADSGFGSTGR